MRDLRDLTQEPRFRELLQDLATFTGVEDDFDANIKLGTNPETQERELRVSIDGPDADLSLVVTFK